MPSDTQIRPFRVEVSESDLADLRDRLARVRWAPEPRGGDEGYGVSRAAVQELVERWRDRYDWRVWEARINEYPQFTTTVDGANIQGGLSRLRRWVRSTPRRGLPWVGRPRRA
jgi:epoxide hydrolase